MRLLLRVLLAACCAAGLVIGVAPPAHADSDRIDRFDIEYRLDGRGVLHVQETIVYRFGEDAGRHGIDRTLRTREPDRDNDEQDIVYQVSEPEVSSPDPISTEVDISTDTDDGGREEYTQWRIGSPDETIDAPTATYVLNYTVEGAVRGSGDSDELYWDATGFESEATIAETSIEATVPGGARDVRCFAGQPGSTERCAESTINDGAAQFSHRDLPAGEGVTVGVKIKPGLVADNRLHTEPAADEVQPLFLLSIPVVLVLAPVVGLLISLRRGRHQRYRDLAPGTFPDPADEPDVVAAGRSRAPVRFSPPDLPVAMTGLLRTGQVGSADIAATLITIAARGQIKITDTGHRRRRKRYEIELLDTTNPDNGAERALLSALFGTKGNGDISSTGAGDKILTVGPRTVQFTDKERMGTAHRRFVTSVRRSAQAGDWFQGKVPESVRRPYGRAVAVVIAVPVSVILAAGGAWPLLLAALGLMATSMISIVVRCRTRHGARTGRGTAWADQLEGFRSYLATAEADQLRFDEGEDIYSAYLPWAIAFGLADRWTKVCRRLADQGRIPDTVGWYGGSGLIGGFNSGAFAAGLGSGVHAAGGLTGSGTGSGGSAFGGGFGGGGGGAGGGGGGGGVGGW